MNNNTEPRSNKMKELLEKIRKNEIVLKPKTYFRLKFVALVALLLVLFVVSLFFSSFILFSLEASGHAALVDFGPSGWQVFFALFPWKLLAIEIVLLVTLEYFLRSFRFGYKIPVLYLFVALILVLMVSGVVVGQTPFHASLLQQADREELPLPFRNLYESTRRPPPRDSGIVRGTILETGGESLLVELDNPRGIGTTTPVRVYLPEQFASTTLSVGDKVFIAGKLEKGEIKVEDIRKAGDRLPPPARGIRHE